jgi:hypothetical protein
MLDSTGATCYTLGMAYNTSRERRKYGRWTTWISDGAPIKCKACETPGATIAREFPDGSRGVYHEECASDLWGENWRSVIPLDPTLIKPL